MWTLLFVWKCFSSAGMTFSSCRKTFAAAPFRPRRTTWFTIRSECRRNVCSCSLTKWHISMYVFFTLVAFIALASLLSLCSSFFRLFSLIDFILLVFCLSTFSLVAVQLEWTCSRSGRLSVCAQAGISHIAVHSHRREQLSAEATALLVRMLRLCLHGRFFYFNFFTFFHQHSLMLLDVAIFSTTFLFN